GQSIVLTSQAPETQMDVILVRADGTGEPLPWLAASAVAAALCFSPSGRWLLVSGTQSGLFVLYAKEVGSAGAIQPITSSTDDQAFGAWWLDDGRIVYMTGPSFRIREVATQEQATGLEVGTPRDLLDIETMKLEWGTLSRDGKRLYGVVSSGGDR